MLGWLKFRFIWDMIMISLSQEEDGEDLGEDEQEAYGLLNLDATALRIRENRTMSPKIKLNCRWKTPNVLIVANC